MRAILTKEQTLYFRSMGKALRVTAVFTDIQEANAYMKAHDSAALIAECGPFLFLADKYDHGERI